MALYLKELKKTGRSAWIYYPDMPNRSEIKVCSLTVVRPEDTEKSVTALLENGLSRLAEEKHLILCFPNPGQGGWECGSEADLQMLEAFQGGMNRPVDEPVPVNEKGIPTYEYMLSTWHPMNDTHYYVGIGKGADMTAALAALRPRNMAAMLLIGARMSMEITGKAVGAPVPAWLCGCGEETIRYLAGVNGVSEKAAEKEGIFINEQNPACRLIVEKERRAADGAFLNRVWETFFGRTRRLNTSVYGDCADRTDLTDSGFAWFTDDDRVDGRPHTWLVHTPRAVREGQISAVPVVFFYHGGSDNPSEAAEMSRFHEIGDKEGFITVYPWSSNRAGWNMELLPEEDDDLSYCKALIEYMLRHYPIDPQRVYLSGFSNGAGMAQTVAMLYPELVAALGHIDSNWPGVRVGRCEVDYADVAPMRLALEKKKTFDWRMPVWYTYGTREASSPVCRGCSQQHQYDFWKIYNNIEVRKTGEWGDPGSPEHGVDGDESQLLRPDPAHPDHYYTVQRFYTMDEKPENYYNFALMHHKGHEVAPMDTALAWEYMKKFRRGKNGVVEKTDIDLP